MKQKKLTRAEKAAQGGKPPVLSKYGRKLAQARAQGQR